jgi:hypothetical protein
MIILRRVILDQTARYHNWAFIYIKPTDGISINKSKELVLFKNVRLQRWGLNSWRLQHTAKKRKTGIFQYKNSEKE